MNQKSQSHFIHENSAPEEKSNVKRHLYLELKAIKINVLMKTGCHKNRYQNQ